jgi:hypothetical protein
MRLALPVAAPIKAIRRHRATIEQYAVMSH